MLHATADKVLLDHENRPYFLWDCDMTLEPLQREVEETLRSEGLDVVAVQAGVTFQRFRVGDRESSCLLDLVAERASVLQDPVRFEIAGP